MNTLKRFGWRVCTAILACILCLGLGTAQAASPFFWDFIDVDITVETDGDLLVRETQNYVFNSDYSNKRYRYIPLKGIGITDVAVYENNEPLSVETGVRNNNYWIHWQHALTPPAAHTFVIQYRVVGGIQVKDNRAQLYWNALFPERSADINRGKVTLHLPDALADRVTSFQGEGVESRDRQINPTTYEFVADGPLRPQQFLKIQMEFPTNALALSNPQTQYGRQAQYWSQTQSGRQTQTNYRRQEPSSLALAFVWAIFFAIPGILIAAIIAIRRRCPNCGKLTLKRTNRIVKQPTRKKSGTREINHTCQNCDYNRRFKETIPRISPSYSANVGAGFGGGYGGGGFSGGGGGFGGGGGGCSGGGGGG